MHCSGGKGPASIADSFSGPELDCVSVYIAHIHVDALHMCACVYRGQRSTLGNPQLHEIWGPHSHHSGVVMPLPGVVSGELDAHLQFMEAMCLEPLWMHITK